MSLFVIIGCGIVIFLATVVASFPFGFVQGFARATGRPLSEGTLSLLRVPEYALELVLAIGVVGTFETKFPEMAFVHALGAIAVATCISYMLDVRGLGMSLRQLWVRFLLGALVCAPIGISLGSVQGVGN